MPLLSDSSQFTTRVRELLDKVPSHTKVIVLGFSRLIQVVLSGVLLYMLLSVFNLFDDEEESEKSEMIFLAGVFFCYLVISLGSFISIITGSRPALIIDVCYSVVGTLLHIAAGAVAIHHFRTTKWLDADEDYKGVIMGTISIVQAVLLAFDAFFVFRISSYTQI